MVPGMRCYANKHALHLIHTDHVDKKPGQYLSALLKLLVPERVLALPHLVAKGTGRPGVVALPKAIYDCIKGIVHIFYLGLTLKFPFAYR